MLYWRTDLLPHAPRDLAELSALAVQSQHDHRTPFGFVWQGARYEGLITVFLEQLGAFGGRILDDEGRVAVDSEAAVKIRVGKREERLPTLRMHSIFTPASLITFPILAISDFIAAASCSGELPVASEPVIKNLSFTSVWFKTRTIS